jgi:iron complex outermembrane receptor protein
MSPRRQKPIRHFLPVPARIAGRPPESETALPVQVITRDDIVRANLQRPRSSIRSTQRIQRKAVGRHGRTARIAAAALRGFGYQNTLILLNGRRITNYAFTTIGGDLNSIPFAAIERVEVLTDGASAIYGSDATAGVINFIVVETLGTNWSQ